MILHKLPFLIFLSFIIKKKRVLRDSSLVKLLLDPDFDINKEKKGPGIQFLIKLFVSIFTYNTCSTTEREFLILK